MSIKKNTDLINFINNETKINNEFNLHKIFKCFCKCFSKSLLDIYNKFEPIENLDIIDSIILGSNMIYHIFWFLIVYTNNLKLTIFLTERAILLYTEFIIMSRDPKINKDLYFTPNISDAISFAYKKSIGPLKISDFKNKTSIKINCIKNASSIIKFILQESFTSIKKENNKNLKIEDIISLSISLCNTLLKIFTKIDSDDIYSFVFDKTVLIFSEFKKISVKLMFWKIYFEILLEFIGRGKKLSILMIILEDVFIKYNKLLSNEYYKIKDELNMNSIKRIKLYSDIKYFVSNKYINING